MVFDPDYWSVFTLNVPSHVQIIVWEDPLLESYITNSRGVKGKSVAVNIDIRIDGQSELLGLFSAFVSSTIPRIPRGGEIKTH